MVGTASGHHLVAVYREAEAAVVHDHAGARDRDPRPEPLEQTLHHRDGHSVGVDRAQVDGAAGRLVCQACGLAHPAGHGVGLDQPAHVSAVADLAERVFERQTAAVDPVGQGAVGVGQHRQAFERGHPLRRWRQLEHGMSLVLDSERLQRAGVEPLQVVGLEPRRGADRLADAPAVEPLRALAGDRRQRVAELGQPDQIAATRSRPEPLGEAERSRPRGGAARPDRKAVARHRDRIVEARLQPKPAVAPGQQVPARDRAGNVDRARAVALGRQVPVGIAGRRSGAVDRLHVPAIEHDREHVAPGPVAIGSDTHRTAAAASTASAALPPSRSIRSPAAVAVGWLVATIASVASAGGLPMAPGVASALSRAAPLTARRRGEAGRSRRGRARDPGARRRCRSRPPRSQASARGPASRPAGERRRAP